MAIPKQRAKLIAALGALVVCLSIAGVTLPARFLRGSKSAAAVPIQVVDVTAETGSMAACDLGLLLAESRPSSRPESRPRYGSRLFFWSEEIATGKSIGELWKEEDARSKTVPGSTIEAPASRPLVAPEDLARARAITVRGIVVGETGSWAVLSTGRVKRNDRIPGLPFRVEAISPHAVTLVAEDQRVVLDFPASRPGKVHRVGD